MVIDRRTEQCAFVDEIEGCLLPAGWDKMPQGQAVWECPAEYSWVENLQCLTEEAAQAEGWGVWLYAVVGLVAAGFPALCVVVVLLVRRRW
jgi:hypothetical protein